MKIRPKPCLSLSFYLPQTSSSVFKYHSRMAKRIGSVRGTVNREDKKAARTHGLHLTVFRAGDSSGSVGTAIPLYDHALN